MSLSIYHQRAQSIAGFMRLKPKIVINCPIEMHNKGKMVILGKRKQAQLRCGRTRI